MGEPQVGGQRASPNPLGDAAGGRGLLRSQERSRAIGVFAATLTAGGAPRATSALRWWVPSRAPRPGSADKQPQAEISHF